MGSSFIFPFNRPIVWPWQDTGYSEEPLSAILVLGLSFVLGCVLLGVVTFRARIYSQLAAALFLAGALIILTPLALDDVVFAAGLIWIGYEIFAGRSEEARNLRRSEPRFDDATAGQAHS
jgi:predicted MFS family arabinose efflux permease